MADRYWVGGTGNWSDTGHWSTTNGGASGASVPTSADNAMVTGFSTSGGGSVHITITASGAVCNDFIWNTNGAGFAASSFAQGNFDLTCSGSFNVTVNAVSSPFWSSTGGTVILNSASAGKTFFLIATGGNSSSFAQFFAVFNGTGAWTYSTSNPFGLVQQKKGTFILAVGSTISVLSFFTDGTDTKVLTLNNAGIAILSSGIFSLGANTGLTFSAGTSQITFASGGIFAGGSLSYHDLSLTDGPDNLDITGSNSFNNFSLDIVGGTAGGATTTLEGGSTQTIAGTLTAKGSSSETLSLVSATPGTEAFLSVATAGTIEYVLVRDNHALGAAIPLDDTTGGVDGGGNTNWLFGPSFQVGQVIII